MAIMVALVAVLLLAVLALSYRLWKLRQGGTAAILRDIPAVGGHGWRHGVIRYRGGEAGFYRLSSLRLWPDRRLSRRGLEIVSRRAPRGDEFDIMTDETAILELRDTTQDRRRGYEIALDRGALTAFLSWLESRPSPRARGVSTLTPIAALPAGHPQHVADLGVGRPGEDEQQVGEPVEVARGDRVHPVAIHRQGRPGGPLGPAYHGAGHVQQRRARAAAGQHEGAQLRQVGAFHRSQARSSR